MVGTDLYVANPFSVPAIASWTWLGLAATITILSAAAGAVGAVVVRFRRAQGDERQQLRWFVYGISVVITSSCCCSSPATRPWVMPLGSPS